MESSNLNSDLIFEILTRISPLKYLDRCKLICKEWNNMAYESTFTPLHGQRTGTITGYFVQSLASNKSYSKFASMDRASLNLSLDFLPYRVEIKASTNQGILCCVSEQNRKSRFCVCKPSTRQWRELPNPKMRYFTTNVAMVVLRSNPLRYKILRLSSPKHMLKPQNNLRCEIFDSDMWAWRELNKISLSFNVFVRNEPAVVASGAVHWQMNNNHVFAFDIDSETYSIFALPQTIMLTKDPFYFKDKQLVEYKGRLGFTCRATDDEYLLLWVMEDYRNRMWRRESQTLSIEAVQNVERYASCTAFYNADIALMKGFCSVIFYKFQNYALNEVKLHAMYPREIFAFRSDFEPIDLRTNV